MSKMSQLHAELEQQAYEKGYESLDEALNDGATIIEETLVTKDDLPSKKVVDGRQQAHEAWLKERDEVIKGLQLTLIKMSSERKNETKEYDDISRALKFIEEGDM